MIRYYIPDVEGPQDARGFGAMMSEIKRQTWLPVLAEMAAKHDVAHSDEPWGDGTEIVLVDDAGHTARFAVYLETVVNYTARRVDEQP